METRTTSINIASKKRIMLKLSGEILVGKQSYGLDPEKLISISNDICNVYKNGKQICIVVYQGLHKELIELQQMEWECLPQ